MEEIGEAVTNATIAAGVERAVEKTTDPRILRTRRLLQQALVNLMKEKEFDSISVQDIAEAATINRATFYDHYPDKFALLECTVGTRFNELLAERGINFDSTCTAALKAMVLGVCDFIASSQCSVPSEEGRWSRTWSRPLLLSFGAC